MNKIQFIEFLEELRFDLKNNPEKWENNTLDDYLEAMKRYTEDIQGYYDNTEQKINTNNIDWKAFSDILKGATQYE